MIDKVFELLYMQPLVSICLGFVLAGFLAWVFRSVITSYIRKKYNLYDEKEVLMAIEKADAERVFYSRTSEKLTPAVVDRVMYHLTTQN